VREVGLRVPREKEPIGLTDDQVCIDRVGTGSEKAAVSGELVTWVQQALLRLGYGPGPVDGSSGPSTRAAICGFQNYANIPATGEIDANLVSKLQAAIRVSGSVR
jgi:peptidoglycan hydrolase-like protein with peptidoglycan-binding domain